MDIMQAVTYPFKGKNAVPVMVIPAGIYFVGMILGVIVIYGCMIPAIFMGSALGHVSSESEFFQALFSSGLGVVFILGIILGTIVIVTAMAPLYGYTWHLTAAVWAHGGNVDAPTWKGNIKTYTKAGFHMCLAYLVLAIPGIFIFFFMVLSLGLLAPFVMAPYALACKEKTFMGCFRAIAPGIQLAMKHYGDWLIATYTLLGISLCYMIVNIGMSFIPGGACFVATAMMGTFAHIYGQLLNEQIPFNDTPATQAVSAWDVAT